MAVALDVAGTELSTTTGGTSVSYTGITVGSGSNRGLVCVCQWDTRTVSSPTATWDNGGTNQSMTLLVGPIAITGNGALAVFGLANPISGNKTLRVAWTTTSQSAVCAVAFTGVDQTGGATSFPHATSATGSGTTSSVTITSATGNMVVAVHSNNASGSITAVNNTQVFIDNAFTSTAAASNRASGAASVAMTSTDSASGNWGAAGTDILAAATGDTFANNGYLRFV